MNFYIGHLIAAAAATLIYLLTLCISESGLLLNNLETIN